MPAYHARPKSADGPLPIVIVVQEIFGVHEHIRDLCRRLAQEGYLAIAPELYFRQGDPNDYSDIPTLFNNLVSKVPDAQCSLILITLPAGPRATGRCTSSAGDRLLLGRTHQLAVCRA